MLVTPCLKSRGAFTSLKDKKKTLLTIASFPDARVIASEREARLMDILYCAQNEDKDIGNEVAIVDAGDRTG